MWSFKTALSHFLVFLVVLTPGFTWFCSAEEIKLEGNRTISCEKIDNVRYVSFHELLTVLDLDQEYSDETGKHTLLSSDRRDGVSIAFTVGSRKIAINREEIFIPYPPVLRNEKIMLPADIVLTALGALRVVPTGNSSSELSEVTFSPFLDFTRLQFIFSAPAEATTKRGANNEILITFNETSLGKESSHIPVNSSHVDRIEFIENEETGKSLTAHIITSTEAEIELFSLENGRRTIIDVIEKNARNRGDSSVYSARNFLSTCKVVIDPGHGGMDKGSSFASGLDEKTQTLKMSQLLSGLMESDGLDVTLSRKADIDLPLLSRLNVINSASPDLVIPIHISVRTPQEMDEPVSSSIKVNILTLRKCEELSNSPIPPGIYTPAEDEIKNGYKLAIILEEEISRIPSVEGKHYQLQHIIPNNRVLAPSVMIDISFLSTATPDDVNAVTTAVASAIAKSVLVHFNSILSRKYTNITPEGINTNIGDPTNSNIQSASDTDSDQPGSQQRSDNSADRQTTTLTDIPTDSRTNGPTGIQGDSDTNGLFNNGPSSSETGNVLQRNNADASSISSESGISMEEFLGPEPDAVNGGGTR